MNILHFREKFPFFAIFIFFTVCMSYQAIAQQWQQTPANPDGAGVTDIIRTRDGSILVTTASWNNNPGFLGGIRRSTNDGQTWENVLDAYNGRTLHRGRRGVIYASAWKFPSENESIYRSTDDGVTWDPLHFVLPGDNIFSINAKDSNQTIFIGTRKGVKRSTNAGVSWLYTNAGIPVNSWVRDIAVGTGGWVAVATTNGAFVSSDNGESWNQVMGIPAGDTTVSVNFGTILPETDGDCEDDNTLFIGTSAGSIILSEFLNNYILVKTVINIQHQNEVLKRGLFALAIYRYLITAVYPRIGIGGGMFISTDNGTTWTPINGGLPSNPKTSAFFIPPLIGPSAQFIALIATYENLSNGARVFLRSMTVGIHHISSEIPDGYKLSQNYPNPFNPTTKIKFNIPSAQQVRLTVYDSSGREVKTLVNSSLQTGFYEYVFEASDLTSGIYFYKLETANFSETRKMMLIK